MKSLLLGVQVLANLTCLVRIRGATFNICFVFFVLFILNSFSEFNSLNSTYTLARKLTVGINLEIYVRETLTELILEDVCRDS